MPEESDLMDSCGTPSNAAASPFGGEESSWPAFDERVDVLDGPVWAKELPESFGMSLGFTPWLLRLLRLPQLWCPPPGKPPNPGDFSWTGPGATGKERGRPTGRPLSLVQMVRLGTRNRH
jgi:hypothetical protein